MRSPSAPTAAASGAVYYDRDGVLHEQRAHIVVMACNGVGTPRILLSSQSGRFPNGLANGNGLVGTHLMFHPYGMVTGVFDDHLDGHKGPLGCVIMSQEFYESDASRGFIRGYTLQMARSSGPLNTALGGLGAHGAIPWGEGHHSTFTERHGRTATYASLATTCQRATTGSRWTPSLRTATACRRPRSATPLSENSRRLLDHAIARSSEALEAAGARQVLVNPLLHRAGWHLMGTARMGTDPERSVVDNGGRSHEVDNLYVIDGSILTTGGAVNPTSTIQALALYIAARIQKTARSQRG